MIMKLIFSEICSKRERRKSLDFVLDLKSFEFEGENMKVIEPLNFTGEVISNESFIELVGNITGELQMKCSRCLTNFSYEVSIDMDEKFTNNSNQEDDSIAYVEGDELNVAEAVVENVISTLPIKRLCSIDCNGLCQKCGIDLNKETCQCDNEEIDLRMAKLMDLFK